MIQDVFSALIPRMTARFKDLFYISDEHGRILLNEQGKAIGLPVSQNLLTIKYKYSTPQEWVNELLSINQTDARKRYPFMYLNSMTVKQDITTNNYIVDIGEIVLAVLSTQKWTSAQRDLYSFKPILNNLYLLLYEALGVSRDCVVIDRGTRKDHYFYGKAGLYGGTENKFADFVDAIEINNLRIRIIKSC